MTKKIFAPLAAVAAFALVALSLIASSGTASAAINGLSVAPTTVNPDGQIVLTIDADEAAGDVRILATSGDYEDCNYADNVTDCLTPDPDGAGPLAAATLENDADADVDFTVNDAGGDINTLFVTWEAPATGPQTVTFTVIQGTSTKTATATVRGTANTIDFRILNGATTSATVCSGTDAEVIMSTSASQGLAAGTLCAVVLDSAGNRLPSQPVVYTTTAGTVAPITDTTGTAGQRATASTIVAGSTGLSGVTATVTASSGGKSATDTVKFGGDPASCSITTDPTSVNVGGAATVMVDVMDSTGGPVPDDGGAGIADSSLFVQQVNPGQGANAAILNAFPSISNGEATTTAIAAIPGAIALGASSNVAGNTTSCTGTLIATGTVVPPVGGDDDGEGEGGFSGEIADDGVSLVVFGGGSLEQLIEAAEDEDATTISATVDGEFIVYVVGAPDFVNETFEDEFADGIAANTAFIIYKR